MVLLKNLQIQMINQKNLPTKHLLKMAKERKMARKRKMAKERKMARKKKPQQNQRSPRSK